ncbi:MAG: PLP-dependent aminotransferase family protein [Gammaproteobacteria bacterium]|uniref:aminotransferase-like domain-containing protein n=1 Tax=Azohydromonas sp. TaxID=1872666 RepID=UPI002C1A8A8E|nr:PLP-dependent aminotransferase family protein [Azohydromonas sp.]HMM85508.1 PLP-dependent aminotransferase family protein [Azohydromonas sp.]
MDWTLARRAKRLNPSVIREILKLTERPGIVSLAGGLPAAEGFPVEALREATARVLAGQPREALQYAASEGHGPLREQVAADLAARGLRIAASQVLITTGSQQGLDLVGKVLLDPGSEVAVEQPTYLGALQAFASSEPRVVALAGDDDGPRPDAIAAARGARFAYLLPNFQNPSGRCLGAARRDAIVDAALAAGVPIVEDDPYADLWLDAPPPAPLAARAGDAAIYLGSFSKVLAPGLRVGYLVAPKSLYPKLLQAKQAADLHTPGFNQRIVHEVLASGMLPAHLDALRTRYRIHRDAMQAALERHLGVFGTACRWQRPAGGMFFWVELPEGIDAAALLPRAVDAGVAYVPGAAFYAAAPRANTLRLSFATVAPSRIDAGIEALARVLREAWAPAQLPLRRGAVASALH